MPARDAYPDAAWCLALSGWEEHFDDDGRAYYLNTATGQTQWEPPELTMEQEASAEESIGTEEPCEGGTAGEMAEVEAVLDAQPTAAVIEGRAAGRRQSLEALAPMVAPSIDSEAAASQEGLRYSCTVELAVSCTVCGILLSSVAPHGSWSSPSVRFATPPHPNCGRAGWGITTYFTTT